MLPSPDRPDAPRRGARLLLRSLLLVATAAATSGCVTREVIVERVPPPPPVTEKPAGDDVAPRVGLMGDLDDPFAPDSERVAAAPAVGWNSETEAPTVRYYSQSGDYDPDAVTVTRYYYGDEGTYYQDAPRSWGPDYDDAYYGGYYSDYYRYGYVRYRPVVYNYYRPYYAYRPYRHYGRPFWAYAGHAYRGPWYAYHGGWYADPYYWGPGYYDAPFFIVASYYDPFYYGGWYYDPFCIRPGLAISFGWGSFHDWGSYYAGYDRGYRDAQLGAGLANGRLHMAAFSRGIGATGMTFYDSEIAGFLGEPLAGLLFTCVGVPAYRNTRGGRPGAPVSIVHPQRG